MYRRRLRAPTMDCVPMGGSGVWIVIQRIQVVVSERVFAVILRSRVNDAAPAGAET